MSNTDFCTEGDVQPRWPSASVSGGGGSNSDIGSGSGSGSMMRPYHDTDATTAIGLSSASGVSVSAAFPCALCPAAFADGLALAVHERAHGVEMRCPLCARSFSQEGDLRRHQRRHGRCADDTAHSMTVRITDIVPVSGGDHRVTQLGEERVPPILGTTGKDSGVEIGGSLSELGSGARVEQGVNTVVEVPATAAASAEASQENAILLVKRDESSVKSSIPCLGSDTQLEDNHTARAENNTEQSESRTPQSESHTLETEGHTSQAENHTPQLENATQTKNHTVASDSSELSSSLLDLPFQCAVCHARFRRVSLLQKHVRYHARTLPCPSPLDRKAAPRRSQRHRPFRRLTGENGDGIGCGSSEDDDTKLPERESTKKRAESVTMVVKKLGRGGRLCAKSSRVATPGDKKVSLRMTTPGAVKRHSVTDSATSAVPSPVRRNTRPTRAEGGVPSGILSDLQKTGTTSTDQQTATATAVADGGAQRNRRRRAVRSSYAFVRGEEDEVDDAPGVSLSPPPTTHSPLTNASAESTPAKLSDRTATSWRVTFATVSPSADESMSPPRVAKEATAEIAVVGQQADERTEAAAPAPVSEPPQTQGPVPGEFECDICHRQLAHGRALERHRRLHFARESFQCDQCPRRYTRFDTLVTHSLKHASEAKYRCQYCHKTYRLRSLLEYHQREHEKNGAVPTPTVGALRSKCTECGKTFSYVTALRRHARLHVGGQQFCCELCPKRYTRFDALVLHGRVHSKRTPFECVICARTFSQRRMLEYHSRTHTGAVMQPPFKCPFCTRSFPDAAQLQKHRLQHASRPSFLCDVCGKEFKSANKLRRHVMTHTGERPLHCDVCGRRFLDSTSLTQHRRIHSGERPFQCHVCGKSFSRNVTLKIHARTHTGEKPYPCGVCGRAFTTATQLRRHVRVHSGERPYVCIVCGRGFSQNSHRKIHMRTHASRPDDPPAAGEPLLEQHHQQKQQQQQQQENSVVQMTPPPPPLSSVQEPHQLPSHQHQQLQHQEGQQHHELYALQAQLPVVGPMDIGEDNMALHFMNE